MSFERNSRLGVPLMVVAILGLSFSNRLWKQPIKECYCDLKIVFEEDIGMKRNLGSKGGEIRHNCEDVLPSICIHESRKFGMGPSTDA